MTYQDHLTNRWNEYREYWHEQLTSVTERSAAAPKAHTTDIVASPSDNVSNTLPNQSSSCPPPTSAVGGADATALRERKLPASFLVAYLKKRRDRVRLGLDLFLVVPVVFLTLHLSLFRFSYHETAQLATAVRAALVDEEVPPQAYAAEIADTGGGAASGSPTYGPNYRLAFLTIHTVNDWRLWWERVVVPRYFDPLHPTAVPSRDALFGQLLWASPLRQRTYQVRSDSCTASTISSSSFDDRRSPLGSAVPCFADFSVTSLNVSVVVTLNATSGETVPWIPADSCGGFGGSLARVQGRFHQYPCGGYVLTLSRDMSFDQALNRSVMWGASGVLSAAATRMIVMESVLYHTALDAYVLVELLCEISAGGSLTPTVNIVPFDVPTLEKQYYGNSKEVANDVLLAICLVWWWVRLGSEWAAYTAKWKSCVGFFWRPWTVATLGTLGAVTASLVVWWVEVATVARNRSVIERSPDNSSGGGAAAGSFPLLLITLARLHVLRLQLCSVAVVLLMLHSTQFFGLSERLSLLTRTFQLVAESIVGLLVIFILFVVAFALCGNVLFGTSIVAYRTLSTSFLTSLQSLLGQFDYHALRDAEPRLAFLYFWSFTILGLFLLLNFITAAICNVFDNQREMVHQRQQSVAVSTSRGGNFSDAVRQFCGTWFSAQYWRRAVHSYIRCAKAFHSLSPLTTWDRLCDAVDTAVKLDEEQLRLSRDKRRRERAQAGALSAVSRSTAAAAGDPNDLEYCGHEAHLVAFQFLTDALGQEDAAALNGEGFLEDVFIRAVHDHNNTVPPTDLVRHWKDLKSVEVVVDASLVKILGNATAATTTVATSELPVSSSARLLSQLDRKKPRLMSTDQAATAQRTTSGIAELRERLRRVTQIVDSAKLLAQ